MRQSEIKAGMVYKGKNGKLRYAIHIMDWFTDGIPRVGWYAEPKGIRPGYETPLRSFASWAKEEVGPIPA